MSLEITLQNAISGLQTTKQSMQVVSNNIANVNTEGYSRKIVETSSRVIDGQGYGVEVSAITRNVDAGVLRQLRRESGTLEELTVRDFFLSQVNQFFGRPEDDNSIAHKISDLGAQFDALAVTPETAATQFLAVKAAQDVVDELERMSEEIQKLRTNVSSQLDDSIDEFNTAMDAVVDINSSVIAFTASNISTVDLEDQRDKALNTLAEFMDINYFEKTDGSVTVFSGGGNTLIDGGKQSISYLEPSSMSAVLTYTPTDATNYSGPSNSDYPIGGIPGIFVGAEEAGNDITTDISSGKMAGLISLRDTELPALQSQLDELAEKLKQEINKVHNQGSGFPPPPTLTGTTFVEGVTSIAGSTGLVTIGIVDESGVQQEVLSIDLSAQTTVSGLATAISAMTNATATVNSDGFLEISAGNDYRVAINEMTSSMSGAGKVDAGFSDFFGLNDLYSSTENFASYRSNYFSSSSSDVITTTGNINISTDGASTSIAIADTLSLSGVAAAINAAAITNVSASVISDGDGFRLEINHASGTNMAITQDGTSTFFEDLGVRADNRGISNRLQVRTDIVSNTFFMSRGALQSNTFDSARTATDPAAAITGGAAGTLTFTIDASTSATVNYNFATTDSLNSVATAINADSTLTAANISAEVIISGSNYSLKITDGDSDNFWITDSLTSATGLGMATSQGVSIGDGSVAADLAEAFEENITFLESPASGGGLAQSTTNFGDYASTILSFNAAQVATVTSDLTFQENLSLELFSKHASVSGVNMDEELSNLIIFEQAYLAAARMIQTTQELFRALQEIV